LVEVNKMSALPSPAPVSPYILLAMTATTGNVDAVNLLAWGHVFTANMTGNVVFLGFALAGSQGFSIPRSSVALIAFLLGGVAGWRLATGAGLVSLALRTPADEGYIPLLGVIGLLVLAMGFRSATTRKLGVPDLTTTVLTLTITGLAADSSLAGGTNPRWHRRVASVLLMFAGLPWAALS
jgi:uncharacterized membrane protein YoaK (UPF0700 family)